jgi:hypothetical protein
MINESGIRGYRNALRGMVLLWMAASLISGVLPGGIIGLGILELIILGLIYKLAEAIRHPAIAHFIPTTLSAGASIFYIYKATPTEIFMSIGVTAVALLIHTVSIIILEFGALKMLHKIKREKAA